MESVGELDEIEKEKTATSRDNWRFISKKLGRPGDAQIDFTKWLRAQTPGMKKIGEYGVEGVREVCCPEVAEIMSADSSEPWLFSIFGVMFAQCFYQYWIDEILDTSEYASWPKEKKLWASNVALESEPCNQEEINKAAEYIRNRLEKYLIENAERLMVKAKEKVEENFFGHKII
jgi:hypothetical protein